MNPFFELTNPMTHDDDMPIEPDVIFEHQGKLADHGARITLLENRVEKMDERILNLTTSTERLLEGMRTLTRWHWIVVTGFAGAIATTIMALIKAHVL
jgi:hypothetical protein